VLLHAVADAILGAVALGDLGDHFPDSDPRWKDVPSAVLVAETVAKARAKGFLPAQVDATVVAERPRLAPHRLAMRERIAALLGLDLANVSVKASSGNGIGALGRGEGIAAMAVVVLAPADDA
jgi:2-C-methyl-D-erythritol 2,4-cyclodiphosphate synthase